MRAPGELKFIQIINWLIIIFILSFIFTKDFFEINDALAYSTVITSVNLIGKFDHNKYNHVIIDVPFSLCYKY